MNEEVGYKKPPKDTRFGGTRGNKRNTKGKPKTFDGLRELAQEIAHEPIGDGNKTVVQAIMRKWAGSNDARLQMAFVKVAFGEDAAQLAIKHSGSVGDKPKVSIYLPDNGRGGK